MIYLEIIIAGIVLYNPDIGRLIRNVKSILPQVNRLLMVDNNSLNFEEVRKYFEKDDKIYIIRNVENYGIAKALNQIMDFATKNGAKWALTLDQDSVCPIDLIENAKKFVYKKDIAIICPNIIDTQINSELTKRTSNNEYEYVTRCISSASLTNIKVWKEVGYFNNEMFIDYVDFDFCARLILSGYKILRLNNVVLDHKLGDCTYRHLLFNKVRISNHSAFRKYYIARNITFFIRKYRKNLNVKFEYLRILKVITYTILYENNKRKKIRAILKGIIHGMKMAL